MTIKKTYIKTFSAENAKMIDTMVNGWLDYKQNSPDIIGFNIDEIRTSYEANKHIVIIIYSINVN